MKKKVMTTLAVLLILVWVTGPAAAWDDPVADPYLLYLPMSNTGISAAAPQVVDSPVPDIGGVAPGDPLTFEQAVPINLVFIGFEQWRIHPGLMLQWLPAGYTPHVRYPTFYGVTPRDLGLEFDFTYTWIHATQEQQQAFFDFLTAAGEVGPRTYYQTAYNDQEKNLVEIPDEVLYLDAPSVELWLKDNLAPQLNADTDNGYTVYFINWYGKPGFQFHVYTKTDQPDPDTGMNFGEVFEAYKMVAWGGSHSRSWFYDFSAGPEWNTTNWLVDEKDLDGDGQEDYRMPPFWEYSLQGYRDFRHLSRDMALLTRYVGINLLFTSSPLYDPLVTAPGVDGKKVAHIEMFEDDPASSGMDLISQSFTYDRLHEFQPYYNWEVGLEDNDPIDPPAERSFRIWAGLLEEDDCWNIFGDPFAQLYCYFNTNLANYVPAYGEDDYVGELFGFNTTDENMDGYLGLLGYADDNWVDGTQSHVFMFDSPLLKSYGYGFTITAVHEFGHHIGLSHPHDGYDSTFDIDYGPGGPFYFAWVGDESNTIMHYLNLSSGFGEFDQDNMGRYEFAGYLNWANGLLDDILADPDAGTVQLWINLAEAQADAAIDSFDAWEFGDAARHARRSYEAMATAAEILGIPTPSAPQNQPVGPIAPRYLDWVRLPEH